MIDPIDDTYMLSELAATITNKISETIGIMTNTLKNVELTNGARFLPRFKLENESDEIKPVDLSAIRKQQAAAAAMFGGR